MAEDLMSRLAESELSRRELLVRGGALAALGLGASAGLLGSPGDAFAAPKASGTFDFIGFQGDDLLPVMKPWLKANNLTMRSTYIGSAADIIAKLSAPGGGGIDLVAMPGNAKRTLETRGAIKPLDTSKIPNLANLDPLFSGPRFRPFTRSAEGEWIAVPYHFLPLAITYDSAVVKGINSWYDALKPQYKNKINMGDFPFGNLAIACHLLKLNMGFLPKSKVPQVVNLLKRFVAQSRSIAPSIGDQATQLVSGEAVIAIGGVAFYEQIAKAQGKKTLKSQYSPKEGVPMFLELLGVAPNADNPDAAYAFINEVLTTKRNAAGGNFLRSGVVAKGSSALLTPANKNLYPYATLRKWFRTQSTFANPPGQSDQFLTAPEWFELWAQIKSGA